jgi:hypothetical protein
MIFQTEGKDRAGGKVLDRWGRTGDRTGGEVLDEWKDGRQETGGRYMNLGRWEGLEDRGWDRRGKQGVGAFW